MKVRDVMSRPVKSCSADANLAEVALQMWHADCGVIPIVDDEDVMVGVLTDRDICMAVAIKGRPAHQIVANELIGGELFSCSPSDDVLDALDSMKRHRVRRLPVLAPNGTVQGVLSINDLILEAKYRRGASNISYKDAMLALQEICEHRPHLPAPGEFPAA